MSSIPIKKLLKDTTSKAHGMADKTPTLTPTPPKKTLIS
jgi:hypothetical protein